MNAPIRIEVSIDDAIRRHPKLLAEVEQATRYFEHEYREGPPLDGSSGPTTLEWTLAPDETSVLARCCEADSYGRRCFTEPIALSYMGDPVNREISVRRLWRSLLRIRGHQIDKRIDDLIRAMEEEEAHGRPVGV